MREAPPTVDVRRAADRFVTTGDRVQSRHSFSFGRHYDGANTSYGLLLAHNEERLAPGGGFPPHPHRDLEILTWVLQGSLVHEDSAGHRGVVRAGVVQRMSAGRGVVHSERNEAGPGGAELAGADPGGADPGTAAGSVHLVQMWVPTDEPGLEPSYQQLDVEAELRGGELVPLASGLPGHRTAAAVGLGNRGAALHAARLPAGRSIALPVAPYVHLFVARGAVQLEGVGALAEGDAVRGCGDRRLTAARPAELLVWEMHADLRA